MGEAVLTLLSLKYQKKPGPVLRPHTTVLNHWAFMQKILHTVGTQAICSIAQLFLLLKIQDCIFTLSFVDKYTNTDFPFIGRLWYFLSQEIPEPPCLGIYHTSPPILPSPGSVTTRLEVSVKVFSV